MVFAGGEVCCLCLLDYLPLRASLARITFF